MTKPARPGLNPGLGRRWREARWWVATAVLLLVAPVGSVAPVALRIPAIGVAVSLSTLGLNPDQTVEVPTDFAQPGWFRLGPTPGQPGAAVILGHVDSYQGPAVFYRLGALQTGDQVEVVLAGGAVAHFAVTTVATYPKDQFPAQQVYAAHGSAPCSWSPAAGSSTPAPAVTSPTWSPTPPSPRSPPGDSGGVGVVRWSLDRVRRVDGGGVEVQR